LVDERAGIGRRVEGDRTESGRREDGERTELKQKWE
jgi:hypothetical protein